jgi:hypothetical protein
MRLFPSKSFPIRSSLLYCQRCVRDADSTVKYKPSPPFNLVILGGKGGHFI